MTTVPLPDDNLPRDGVSPELLDQLHEANKKFGRAREHMEEAIGAEENVLAERGRASHEIGDAEKELEAVEEQIDTKLKMTEDALGKDADHSR